MCIHSSMRCVTDILAVKLESQMSASTTPSEEWISRRQRLPRHLLHHLHRAGSSHTAKAPHNAAASGVKHTYSHRFCLPRRFCGSATCAHNRAGWFTDVHNHLRAQG